MKALLLLLIVVIQSIIATPALLGLDLGSENFKLAVARPGGLEIIMNEGSNRKTLTAIGYEDKMRYAGDASSQIAIRASPSNFNYFLPFMGRKVNSLSDPWTADFLESLVWAQTATIDPDTKNLVVTYDDQTYRLEELLGQLFEKVMAMGKAELGHTIKDMSITVPSYWTHAQRRAILDAAELAGMNIMSLINQNLAIAVNYGIERGPSDGDAPQIVMFVDVGAMSTEVSIFKVEAVPGKKKTAVQLTLLADAWDETVGGRYFDLLIADMIKAKATKQGIAISPSGLAKIMRQAKKSKEVLSANRETYYTIENLANDIDIKGSITRDELEAASAKLVLRINKVVETAMNQAGLSAGDLHFVELFGGGTRVPRIQQSLQELLGRETLDKHLNSDEAAAVGAAFIAATQSSQMKGKEFKLKNATQSGVEVIYSIPNTGKTDKLYNTTSRFGTKRVIKLNTTEEFDVILAYQGLSDLPLEGTSHNLGTFRFSNLPTAETVVNMTGEPLVKVRIHLTDSGLVEMLGAEANVTYMGQREVKVPRPLPDDYVEEFEEVETDAPTNFNGMDFSGSESISISGGKMKRKIKKKPVIEYDTVVEEAEKSKVVALQMEVLSSVGLTKEHIRKGRQLLSALREQEKALMDLEEAKNALEAYIYHGRDVLEEESFVTFSTEAEREKLTELLAAAGEFLESEEGETATRVQYSDRKRKLAEIVEKVENRPKERLSRKTAVESCESTYESVEKMLYNITNIRQVEEEDVEDVMALLEETRAWVAEQDDAEDARPLEEDAVVRTRDFDKKCSTLFYKGHALTRKPLRKPKKVAKDEVKEEVKEESVEEPTVVEEPVVEAANDEL